jgi:REP element-mobilizing transposase RayT
VTSHAVADAALFADDADRELFVSLLERVVERCAWLCHAYCLMTNHYHALVETPAPNLGEGVRWLNGVYAQLFNRIHGRSGHLFQARYHAALVQRDSHLLEVARYIVLNPVRAGLCSQPAAWRWSSYRATAGIEPSRGPVYVDALLGHFGSRQERAMTSYRAFVADALGTSSHVAPRRRFIGTPAFVRSFLRGGQTPGSDPGV